MSLFSFSKITLLPEEKVELMISFGLTDERRKQFDKEIANFISAHKTKFLSSLLFPKSKNTLSVSNHSYKKDDKKTALKCIKEFLRKPNMKNRFHYHYYKVRLIQLQNSQEGDIEAAIIKAAKNYNLELKTINNNADCAQTMFGYGHIGGRRSRRSKQRRKPQRQTKRKQKYTKIYHL